jgi:hypothetical protein
MRPFDIRAHVRNPHVTKHQPVYQMINVMCYLLDITYHDLFRGRLTDFIDVAKRQINHATNGPLFFTQDEREALSDGLDQIADWVNRHGHGQFVLKLLYTARRNRWTGMPFQDPEKEVWNQFNEIRKNFPQFCMPFLDIKKPITGQDIDDWLDGDSSKPGVGSLKLIDLYTNPRAGIVEQWMEAAGIKNDRETKTSAERALYRTIKAAQAAGLLINHNEKPNDCCCSTNGGCADADPKLEKFCSESSPGVCSASSDPC